MAWQTHAASNDEMCEQLQGESTFKAMLVLSAREACYQQP
jgi:hypothetical protein